ncbi:MFS transporter [Subtercola lobariae]|uniref:Major facilitator superfamily protein n=1 Tax=Subtercola lobariae TaxID=1588641 RepID=A0A917EWB7_9MICO|nr:MFS transporter [Subtercola lobariae]GGF21258.1 putative major facilitator superfamily protein [Subtercola lobariae]
MAEKATRERGAMFSKDHPKYKWVALSNTTLGMLMVTINSSIVLISLPAIFKGIQLNPLEPGNVSYLLWMLMGFILVTAVLTMTFGRLGDIYGRVKIYNMGFVIFTLAAIALVFDPFLAGQGALWLIGWRVVQAVGGAMIFANSTAILTDAFPANKRGMAIGINQIAAIAGSFLGLLIGGVLATIDWHLIFLVSVPFGILGTIWSFKSLHEVGQRNPGKVDIPGNVLFAVGLISLLTGITYGIQPYGDSSMGWTNPWVLGAIIGGIALLVIFVFVELHHKDPLFNVRLFAIKAFAFGNVAGLLAAISRGGMQFMLIIWLQGIWLPLHGFSYESTPLWAGIYLLPLTVGFLISGPLSGTLSDKFGARTFAVGGLLLVAATFVALLLIPVNFNYGIFAVLTFLNGVGSGMFAAPNRTAIMNSVPANQRGAASGMTGTFQNAGNSLSIGIFFSLMIVGLAATLPSAMYDGLTAHGITTEIANQVAATPPVGSLFAAFLGYNPIESILGPTGVLNSLSPANAAALTGQTFFPQLISDAFHSGLVIVFTAAAVLSVLGAIASFFAGGKYMNTDTGSVKTAKRAEPSDLAAELSDV